MILEKHLNPHFMCLSEHHMKEHEISNFSVYGLN